MLVHFKIERQAAVTELPRFKLKCNIIPDPRKHNEHKPSTITNHNQGSAHPKWTEKTEAEFLTAGSAPQTGLLVRDEVAPTLPLAEGCRTPVCLVGRAPILLSGVIC